MPKYTEMKDDNYVIRIGNNMATIEYDHKASAPGNDSLKPYYSHEFKTMVKEDDQWKIASLTTIDSLSFTSGDSGYIEDNLNATGYRLLNAKKIKDAIEVFKVNVKLFPHSWNVYDSLGEAYADNDNTDDAIKNYEMSVKINPKNDSGKQALEKLEKKK
jgi:tetratricopeptide (TPR) repeat protein